MAWIDLGSNVDLFPGDESTPGEIVIEEKPMPFGSSIDASTAVQGFDLGTIRNPSYGNGIVLPILGEVQFDRPVSGQIKPRPDNGIVYPVP